MDAICCLIDCFRGWRRHGSQWKTRRLFIHPFINLLFIYLFIFLLLLRARCALLLLCTIIVVVSERAWWRRFSFPLLLFRFVSHSFLSIRFLSIYFRFVIFYPSFSFSSMPVFSLSLLFSVLQIHVFISRFLFMFLFVVGEGRGAVFPAVRHWAAAGAWSRWVQSRWEPVPGTHWESTGRVPADCLALPQPHRRQLLRRLHTVRQREISLL